MINEYHSINHKFSIIKNDIKKAKKRLKTAIEKWKDKQQAVSKTIYTNS